MQTLDISGEMTIYTAAEQKKQLLAFIDSDHELAINLSKVTELDTAGTQLLIMVKQEAKRTHKNLHFVMPSKTVLNVLALGNLSTLFMDLIHLIDEDEHIL